MKSQLIPIDRITVLDCVERDENRVADDRDRKSIEASGIQQPLVLIEHGKRLLLAKGLRRLRIAGHIGLTKVPAVIHPLPEKTQPEAYVRELRLVLDMHRQDLMPSQKAEVVETLKRTFGMTNHQVAAYLGIASDSVTNWLAVKQYVPPVVQALDSGRLTMKAARVFIGMSEVGQEEIWRQHAPDLMGTSGNAMHRTLRKTYPPKEFPDLYRKPNVVAERLARRGGKRTGVARPSLSTEEKRRLLASFEMKESEVREGKDELAQLKAEITAAIAPISAIIRSPELWSLVPEETREEFSRFAEVFI